MESTGQIDVAQINEALAERMAAGVLRFSGVKRNPDQARVMRLIHAQSIVDSIRGCELKGGNP